MLVLSRKQNQTIRINDDIVITVTQIKGQQVRIGIDAPQDVSISRGELCNNFAKADAGLAVEGVPEAGIPEANPRRSQESANRTRKPTAKRSNRLPTLLGRQTSTISSNCGTGE